jgi:hypothetical protein
MPVMGSILGCGLAATWGTPLSIFRHAGSSRSRLAGLCLGTGLSLSVRLDLFQKLACASHRSMPPTGGGQVAHRISVKSRLTNQIHPSGRNSALHPNSSPRRRDTCQASREDNKIVKCCTSSPRLIPAKRSFSSHLNVPGVFAFEKTMLGRGALPVVGSAPTANLLRTAARSARI